MFSIFIEKRAIKELHSLPGDEQKRILESVSFILTINPFPVGGNPKRLKGEKAFRLRIGNYRVLYTIEKNLIRIYAVGHRKDVYR